jgi:hypothetical protein
LNIDLEEMFNTKDALIVLALEGKQLQCYFSDNLDDSEVLDILAFATSEMYKTVE